MTEASTLRRRKIQTDEDDQPDGSLLSVSSSSFSDDDDDDDNGKDKPRFAAMPSPSPPIDQHTSPCEPSAFDSLVNVCCSFASATFTTDQGIKVVQWTCWFLAHLTAAHPNTELSEGLRKVFGDLSMARYILRFYGVPQSIEGIRSGSWAGGTWRDKNIHKLGKFMAWTMLFYYPLEHLAYVGWSVPNLLPAVDANQVSAYSCRFWTAYIVGDMLASVLKWRELRARLSGQSDDGTEKDRETILEERSDIKKQIRNIKLQLFRLVLFIFPAIHWSLSDWATSPWLSERTCNLLMLAEAYACIHQTLSSMNDE